MYLIDLMKKKMPTQSKILHIKFALEHSIIIPNQVWKIILNSFIKDTNSSKDECLFYEILSCQKINKKNIQNLKNIIDTIKTNNINIPTEYLSTILELVSKSKNTTLILNFLDLIPNLNTFLKYNYYNPLSFSYNIKIFIYLKKRNYKFDLYTENAPKKSLRWIISFLNADIPINANLIHMFFKAIISFDGFNYNELKILLKRINDYILIDNTLLKSTSLYLIDRIIVNQYLHKRETKKLLNIRQLFVNQYSPFKNSNINNLFFPNNLDTNEIEFINSNFNHNLFSSNKDFILKNNSYIEQINAYNVFQLNHNFLNYIRFKDLFNENTENEIQALSNNLDYNQSTEIYIFLKKHYKNNILELMTTIKQDQIDEYIKFIRCFEYDLDEIIKYETPYIPDFKFILPTKLNSFTNLIDIIRIYKNRFNFVKKQNNPLDKIKIKDIILYNVGRDYITHALSIGYIPNNKYNKSLFILKKNNETIGCLNYNNDTNSIIDLFTIKNDIVLTNDDIKKALNEN